MAPLEAKACVGAMEIYEPKNLKNPMHSLFERIGGAVAVDAAVDLFYQKVVADPRIKHFFDGVDMKRQSRHQKRFLTYAFGGMPNYKGRSLRIAHQRLVDELNLTDEHFDAVVENLGATLHELGVAESLIAEVAAIAESVRNDVLNRAPALA